MKKHSGFTLIEMIVAIVIISTAMGAILTTVGNYTRNATYLKQKTLAHWVAMNTLTELQVSREFPATGDKKGSASMADFDWLWEYDVIETPDPQIRRVEIEVKLKGTEGTLAWLVGYVSSREKIELQSIQAAGAEPPSGGTAIDAASGAAGQ